MFIKVKYAWEIEDLLSKVCWSIQSITTPLSRYSCDLVLCWCVYTGFDFNGYDWLYSLLRRVRGHSRWNLLPPGTYSHTCVSPSVLVVSNATLIPGLLCLWTNDYRLTDDGRLFPSLYLNKLIISTTQIIVQRNKDHTSKYSNQLLQICS